LETVIIDSDNHGRDKTGQLFKVLKLTVFAVVSRTAKFDWYL